SLTLASRGAALRAAFWGGLAPLALLGCSLTLASRGAALRAAFWGEPRLAAARGGGPRRRAQRAPPRAQRHPLRRLLPVRLRGTLAPFSRASLRPMAIACLRLVTFRPDLPDFSVPRLRRRIALSTVDDAFFEYFRLAIKPSSSGSY